jgi:hypothetical protein
LIVGLMVKIDVTLITQENRNHTLECFEGYSELPFTLSVFLNPFVAFERIRFNVLTTRTRSPIFP